MIPDMPEPTISITEARKRFGSLSLSHRQLIAETRAYLASRPVNVNDRTMSKYLYRQLVQYGQRYIRQLSLDL